MLEYFNIIQAICRSSLADTPVIAEHHINRLIQRFEADNHIREAQSLRLLLEQSKKNVPLIPTQISTSSLIGEKLTNEIPIPVDKETATPILEVFMTDDLPNDKPLFNKDIEAAINSVIVEWSNYDKLLKMQATPSRSCLIYGEPGTGKTHLAKWIAKCIGLPIVLARLDGIVSSFLGTSSRNIANLFKFANRYKCILLLDEFDALAKLRNDPQEIGEVKRIVNSLLQNLDDRAELGFTIGVTNHEKLLDPAVWRRFDVQVKIPNPVSEVRKQLLIQFLKPLEYDEAYINFFCWCLDNATGADVKKFSNWLKRANILGKDETSMIDLMKQYVILNTGRISQKVKDTMSANKEDIVRILLENESIDLKKKDVAQLMNITPSSLSKQLSKKK